MVLQGGSTIHTEVLLVCFLTDPPQLTCAVCTAYDSARAVHSPAGLIDGSTCDILAKTVQAKCGHHSGILHQPPVKYW